jgi:hypothetical protein
MSQTRHIHSDITLRKGRAELIDRLEPLWLALHAHHQSVQPGFAYVPDQRSWELRRSCYQRWILQEDSGAREIWNGIRR